MKKLFVFLFLFSLVLFAQKKFPDWADGIVWYQIFPERFANGDTANDPDAEKVFADSKSIPENWKVKKWTSNWFSEDDWEKKLGGNVRDHMYERRYGGDIQGIIDHLDYLKDLGVGAIYLNPVFDAVSLHKYDGSTYHHIDTNFGQDPEGDRKLIDLEKPDDPKTWSWTSADKLFLKLIEEVHKRGMRIVIDGVFNHTGRQFWAFKDIVKNQENSLYKDWYRIISFDHHSTLQNEFDYKGWWGAKSLPEFNRTENDLFPGPKQYVFNSTQRWMDPNGDGDPSDGIDGWRLDVAKEVPMGFWRDWSKLVKSLNPEAIIIGELWELSPDFVSADGPFDALMNYNFAFAVNDFFIADKSKITTAEFVERLMEVQNTYPLKNLNLLQNLVDSHDTDRLLSIIKNPDRQYDRDGNEGNKNYNPGKPSAKDYELQKLVLAFQMTYQGAPMIYYGDEVGMWGADDPHDRKPMVWSLDSVESNGLYEDNLKYDDEVIDESSGFHKGFGDYTVEQNKNILEFYKKLIAIRNKYPCLQKGIVKFLFTGSTNPVFVFERKLDDKRILVAFNLSETQQTVNQKLELKNVEYKELLSDESGKIISDDKNAAMVINLNPKSFKIFTLKAAD
jgi:cyclomaltodextrinase / maltogenic alpha-amylase / neopullulanase